MAILAMKVKLGEIKIPKSTMVRYDEEEFAEIETSTIELETDSEIEEEFNKREGQKFEQTEEQKILAELEKIKKAEEEISQQTEKIVENVVLEKEEEIGHDQFQQIGGADDSIRNSPSIALDDQAPHSDEDFGHNIIFRAKSIFPFDFFPDELVIEETRVILKHSMGPFGKRLFSILIKEVSSFRLSTSIFFGKIVICDVSGGKEIAIDYLGKRKAIFVKGILNRLCERERKKVSGLPTEPIDDILKDEGQGKENFIDTGW